ncbi:aminomethyl-transferring glycine dehydrogenase [Mucilaginibacter rubeus]|uniref:Glycine dehydrogenase (decarboxylating) n=1 Tax=Mucilaginibacter rubeus TaxID=2027860 RepID=A0AAE6JH72_9SPHI|nr:MULTISPECIES: aminomethyl-transferring glycine dehydrogenase [Mucilaginibacter]QEM05634.1 aminomethyl-transferring glycine dehydrogenase [Mucilaginibacter rubeus]QEM18221.1 aminomethyl-transferring glycine dehydrogenase [Mucilaginibacter gossypii]QTE45246.1 aminomethyl-transferring glycine dehydrogenase [Mucilaginibacter rubeus]QTE51842.1 aminomethyl-transferring glycine dehydrogenase [Mucilaginibacter rubeus]QTE56930.1 aminomethyl-transferring glycine dehydrogenase [Mucilaginibacter rubeus
MKLNTTYQEQFQSRHIAPSAADTAKMLKTIGVSTLDELIEQTIPQKIRLAKPLNLPAAKSEFDYLNTLKQTASKNKVFKSFIGKGYYDVIVPGVIQRNILENPGWYTQYTPYQAEIAQGRLQALLNFQTMVIDLTGMEIANASLLDEGTAAAEAMFMQYTLRKNNSANVFFVSEEVFPQTIDILKTRSEPYGIELRIGDHRTVELTDDMFGAIVQYPAGNGAVYNYADFAAKGHEKGIKLTVVADIMSLALLTPPGEWGADIVVGSSQRFGVPMGFGGPHAAFFATKEEYKRSIPGRIIGVTIDSANNYALRMALQTREQHIRRDKATSNICTAQALLAIMAGMYAVYHGPDGIKLIAERIHGLAVLLAKTLGQLGYEQLNEAYFDTVKFDVGNLVGPIHSEALNNEMNLNYEGSIVTIAIDETTSVEDIKTIVRFFAKVKGKTFNDVDFDGVNASLETVIPTELQRTSAYLTHSLFNTHRSEHEMLRYIKSLEAKDLSLCHSMIALGSCTMKLNATTEMVPVTWAEFSKIHPFAPTDQVGGYMQLFDEINNWLSEITGFAAMSLQPNAGAQGEYAGLMVIRAYHNDRGDSHRNIALIPSSAHGTNPASAAMAGMKIVVVKCDDNGNIDVADMRAKAEQYKNELSCLMVTYPSTHGVFEESIIEICEIIHENGGQVYMDGANMNAQVGLTSPANIGADVCHLNLHKTFCIPHGGGGPGMGPIGVAKHLVPYLPGHAVVDIDRGKSIHAVSAAPWGSASILIISHAYIAMMGAEGLTNATRYAILNANYIKARLQEHYPVLYAGANGRCAHEMILDCRSFKSAGIEVTDIAKRLMDYGFHAPTVSFPVAGTVMVEPTESEPKHELDRFCDAMISIRHEIADVVDGLSDKTNNPLKNAPHTVAVITGNEWEHPYTRQKAAFPLPYVAANKFWPSVGRVNDTYGDRTLICSCPPLEEYEFEESVIE